MSNINHLQHNVSDKGYYVYMLNGFVCVLVNRIPCFWAFLGSRMGTGRFQIFRGGGRGDEDPGYVFIISPTDIFTTKGLSQ